MAGISSFIYKYFFMKNDIQKLQLSIKRWIVFFMIGLIVSGATAFDIPGGISWLNAHVDYAPIQAWILKVQAAIVETNGRYPFLLYGYDWLAFAHIVIAIAFIGPYKNPVQNIWVIEFGMIACAMVIPAAFIMGAIRHIPVWWRIIDCLFGVAGIIPLAIIWWKIEQLKLARSIYCHTIVKRAAKDVSAAYKTA
jgi:hypothetical protein